jgi:hypothetical protein
MIQLRPVILAFLIGSGVVPSPGAASSPCADLALVLAIDGSGSIGSEDFALQQTGYARAFTDRRVLDALRSAGTVDVAVVLWGDEEMSVQVMPWRRLAGPGDAVALAAAIGELPRGVTGDTGIGRGIWAALDLLDEGQSCAARRIINVSGDGQESVVPRTRRHVPLTLARARAEAAGVTINGLAITKAVADLDGWYRDRVIAGPDAFVMTINSFEAFGEAIVRKLVREIALPTLAAADIAPEARP